MSTAWLAVSAVFTLVVIRLLAARAVLSIRPFAVLILLGALYGPLALETLHYVAGADVMYRPPYEKMAGGMLAPLIVGVPAFAFLLFLRAYRRLSIADAFLIAFTLGFGCDLFLRTLAAPLANSTAVRLLPVWTLEIQYITKLSGAGFAYWIALPALVFAASMRFFNKRIVVVLTTVALLLSGLELANLVPYNSQFVGNPGKTFSKYATMVTFHGQLVAWLSIIGLIAFSCLEGRWVAAVTATAVRRSIFGEWALLLTAFAEGRFRQMMGLAAAFRVQRQAAIASAELASSPDDATLEQAASHLRRRSLIEGGAETALADRTTGLRLLLNSWPSRQIWPIGFTIASILLLFLLPRLSGAATELFWKIPVLHFPFPFQNLRLLGLALLAFVVWRILISPPDPATELDADTVLAVHGWRWIVYTALAMAVIAVVYPQPQSLYELSAPFLRAYYEQHLPVPLTERVTTLMLLFAAGTVTLAAEAIRPLHKPVPQSEALFRNLALGVLLLAVIWPTLIVFDQSRALLSGWFRETFRRAFGYYGDMPPINILSFIVTAAFAFIWTRALLRLPPKLAQLFVRPRTGQPAAGERAS
jgi:hypothetical protein